MNIQERWQNVWRTIRATSVANAVFEDLLRAYREKERSYHTLKHIEDCLRQLDRTYKLVPRPAILETAIWFHDVVYNPQAHDNEEQSAVWAVQVLQQAEVVPQIISDVERLILSTMHQQPPTLLDERLLCDIDLSILGQTPAKFDQYEIQIRQEYAWVTEDTYRTGRTKILESFLNRPRIYQTTPFHEYETQARENLTRSISKLL